MPDATILDTILAHKQDELRTRIAQTSRAAMQARAAAAPPPRDFLAALETPRRTPVALIAEVKRASPSAGIIRPDFDPVAIARDYEKAGAACLSVLTDERFFQGHDDYLRAARSAVSLPVLRKDFVIDSYQIDEARALGADAVLLIASALSNAQIATFQARAHALGMAALVETHNEDEMAMAARVHARLIGINNRDLSTFITDLGTTERLAALAPPGALLVAESGIRTHADVVRVAQAGAQAVLVGETLMRSPDIPQATWELLGDPLSR